MSNGKLLLVFSLFIVGLAVMSVLRERSAARDAVSAVVDVSKRAATSTGPDGDRRSVPDIHFQDARGQTRSLGDFSGRYVLLNIWATWCTPCREEMPSLDALQRAMSDLPFDVVAISIDQEGLPAIRRFYDQLRLHTLEVYVDTTSEAVSKLGIVGIPASMMIDPSGKELWRISGPVAWDNPEVIARLRRDAAER